MFEIKTCVLACVAGVGALASMSLLCFGVVRDLKMLFFVEFVLIESISAWSIGPDVSLVGRQWAAFGFCGIADCAG